MAATRDHVATRVKTERAASSEGFKQTLYRAARHTGGARGREPATAGTQPMAPPIRA